MFLARLDFFLAKLAFFGILRVSHMLYRTLANLIMIIHAAWVLLLLFGAFYMVVHPQFIQWYLVSVSGTILLNLALGFCPLTAWEERLRRRYDPNVSFNNSFVTTYLHALTGWHLTESQFLRMVFYIKLVTYLLAIVLLAMQ